jgi:hypothetical protein
MAARASLYRTESRWGLYHYRVDHPDKNDADWNCHVQLKRDPAGRMVCEKRPVEPFVVELDEDEKSAYQRLRVAKQPVAA